MATNDERPYRAVTYMPGIGAYYAGYHEEYNQGMQALASVRDAPIPIGTPKGSLAASVIESNPAAILGNLPRNKEEMESFLHPKAQKIDTILEDPQMQKMAAFIGQNRRAILEGSLKAANFDIGLDNLEHLILIRLHNQLMGEQMRWFWLDNAYNNMTLNQLFYRMSFRDNPAMTQEVPARGEYDTTELVYDEIEFNLTKKITSWDITIEDRLRAMIDPTIGLGQTAEFSMAYYREQEALDGLQKLKYYYKKDAPDGEKFDSLVEPGNTNAARISNLNKLDVGGVHSKYFPANEIQYATNDFMKENDIIVTHGIASPKTAMLLAQNTWTENNTIFNVGAYRTGGGVRPFPGIDDMVMIIARLVPDNVIYMISKPQNVMIKAEGPKITETWHDNNKHRDQTQTLDFHQYKCAVEDFSKIDRRFGFIMPISTQDA